MDAQRFEHGAHRTARDDARAGGRRPQYDAPRAVTAVDVVMQGAALAQRRPPFTTFATRLMWTRRSTNSLSRSSRPWSRPRPPSPSRAIFSFRHLRGDVDRNAARLGI